MTTKGHVSLRDLARQLGVSPSTVSLALKDDHRIAKETRARVVAEARKTGYRPNALLSSLLSPKKGPIDPKQRLVSTAFIVESDPLPLGFREKHYGETDGLIIQQFGYQLGHHCEIFNLRQASSPERLRDTLYHRGVQGIIIGPILGNSSPRLCQLDWSAFSVVVLQRQFADLRFIHVRTDVGAVVRQAWAWAMQCGCHRPAFALCQHEPVIEDDRERLGALLEQYHTCPAHVDWVEPYLGPIADESCFLSWLRAARPDCVIGFNGFHRMLLQQTGWLSQPGHHYAQLHIESTEDGASEITGALHLSQSLAEQCVHTLDHLIRAGSRGFPQHLFDVVIPPVWQQANSGNAPARVTLDGIG